MSDNSSKETIEQSYWAISEKELEYKTGDFINIGWYCSDRICDKGKANKIALIYEGLNNNIKKYSYNDARLNSNTIADFLKNLGTKQEDRVCLFMDKIPELYFSILSILKLGAIAQPLFSAFGDESLFVRLENAETKIIITQQKHLFKIRKIADKLPSLEKIIVVDWDKKNPLKEKEISFFLEETPPIENFEICKTGYESPSILHYTSGTTGQPKGVVHVHGSLISQYITTKQVLDLKDDDIYWCTADPGWVLWNHRSVQFRYHAMYFRCWFFSRNMVSFY